MKSEQNKDRVYRLTRNAAPMAYILPTRDTRRARLLYFDEAKNQQRALRYAINQRSPFVDEQDDNAIVEPVVFENGFLRVPATNPVLQEFLKYHPLNGKSFTEVDPEVDASRDVDKLLIESQAVTTVANMNEEELMKIARIVLSSNISSLSPSEIRRDVVLHAKRNPEKFLQAAKDPNVKIQSTIRELFDYHLLAFRNGKREVFFNLSDNKKRMMTVPLDTDPFVAMEQYFLTESGIEDLKMLQVELKAVK